MYHKLYIQNSCNTVYRSDMVSFRYIIVNTLHKSDNTDDDDDDNNNNKEAEKILNYKELTIEIQCMWNVKTKVIPVIRKYVSNIPGKHEVKELQKTAILDTAHILRKVLM